MARKGDEILASVKKDFDGIKIEVKKCSDGERLFDPIRKKFLKITPEEIVRQKAIMYFENNLGVPEMCMLSEESMAHHMNDDLTRMDIVISYPDSEDVLAVVECKREDVSVYARQVGDQAADYAFKVNAKFFILTNGVDICYYHKTEDDIYSPVDGVLDYAAMLEGEGIKYVPEYHFERLPYDSYFDIETLKSEDWYAFKIGEDTPEELIPVILNLDDCLLDYSSKLTELSSRNIRLIEDLGVQFRNYNDASGGGFGTNEYRLFMVEDSVRKTQCLVGFGIQATGKSVGDPKYGTRAGLSALVGIYVDGDVDEMSVQINLNKFLKVSDSKKAYLSHNGAVTRKGARKEDLFDYLGQYTDTQIRDGKLQLGEMDYSIPLKFENADVAECFSKLIEYVIYREQYKKRFSTNKRK